jgi:hypothetical protein
MTDADRRAQLLTLWLERSEEERESQPGKLNFLHWLQTNRPDLIVNGRGDPYQILVVDLDGNAN